MPNSLHNQRQTMLEETNISEYNQSYYLIYDKDNILDARWHGNAFRHLNHSCMLNCAAIKRHVYGVQIILIVSTRDIAAGEECTLHYGSLKPTPCKCSHCFGTPSHNLERHTLSHLLTTTVQSNVSNPANDASVCMFDANNDHLSPSTSITKKRTMSSFIHPHLS